MKTKNTNLSCLKHGNNALVLYYVVLSCRDFRLIMISMEELGVYIH